MVPTNWKAQRVTNQDKDRKWASQGCLHPVERRRGNKVSTPKGSGGARGTHALQGAEGRSNQDTQRARWRGAPTFWRAQGKDESGHWKETNKQGGPYSHPFISRGLGWSVQ